MSIANDLNDVVEASGDMLARLAIFADHIPDEWITAAAALSEKATIRRRRLPSDMVLWLVVGMAFFRNEPISEVAEVARCLNNIVQIVCNRHKKSGTSDWFRIVLQQKDRSMDP
ncbi:hypothetical protein BFG06_17420 [Aeromonas caviae]|nr:hypothetical protein BFG06_17420 [Aeromonas caviae]